MTQREESEHLVSDEYAAKKSVFNEFNSNQDGISQITALESG